MVGDGSNVAVKSTGIPLVKGDLRAFEKVFRLSLSVVKGSRTVDARRGAARRSGG